MTSKRYGLSRFGGVIRKRTKEWRPQIEKDCARSLGIAAPDLSSAQRPLLRSCAPATSSRRPARRKPEVGAADLVEIGMGLAQDVELRSDQYAWPSRPWHAHHHLVDAKCQPVLRAMAASSIRAETSAGCDASEAWLAARVMTLRGFIRSAIRFSFSGFIIRSSLEI